MRILYCAVALSLTTCMSGEGDAGSRDAANKERCASFGFQEGTNAFANCVMKFSLTQDRQAPPDRETLLRQYRSLSIARRGDNRYPVCTGGMMDNELDTSANKWVGPDCQMAPD